MTVAADVAEGGDRRHARLTLLREAIEAEPLPDGASVAFAGEAEEQREAATFLTLAFGSAIFLMGMILVTQFNSLYQAALVLSAILFSTSGVLIGLLVTGQTFGIVMVGIGIIALAGIVVNNNIVLIDTWNGFRAKGAGADRGLAADRLGAGPPGAADGGHDGARADADGAVAEHRLREPELLGRGAVDAVVDAAGQRDRRAGSRSRRC